VHARGGNTLGRGREHEQRVAVDGLAPRGIGEACPRVDNELAVEVRGYLQPDLGRVRDELLEYGSDLVVSFTSDRCVRRACDGWEGGRSSRESQAADGLAPCESIDRRTAAQSTGRCLRVAHLISPLVARLYARRRRFAIAAQDRPDVAQHRYFARRSDPDASRRTSVDALHRPLAWQTVAEAPAEAEDNGYVPVGAYAVAA
jgi:hypothetical protein